MTSALPLSQSGTKATDIPGKQAGRSPQDRRAPAYREPSSSSTRSRLAAGTRDRWDTSALGVDWVLLLTGTGGTLLVIGRARGKVSPAPGAPEQLADLRVCAVWKAGLGRGSVSALRLLCPGYSGPFLSRSLGLSRGWNPGDVWLQIHFFFRHHSGASRPVSGA